MANPGSMAHRPVRQRTVTCPFCGAPKWHACFAVTEAEIEKAKQSNVWNVRPHLVRRRAEAEYALTKRSE